MSPRKPNHKIRTTLAVDGPPRPIVHSELVLGDGRNGYLWLAGAEGRCHGWIDQRALDALCQRWIEHRKPTRRTTRRRA